MERSPHVCPVVRSLDVVGTRSTMLLLREAFYGTRRFDGFARRVDMTEAVAATRLRAMVADGLLDRVPYREPGQRTRHEYRLTAKGRALYPVVVSLMQWAQEWEPTPEGPAITLTHRDCGEPVQAEIRCAAGHPLSPTDVDARLSPHLLEARERLRPSR